MNKDHNGLTAREVEVLRLLVCEHQNKAVAIALGISKKTVDKHRVNLHHKIGTTNILGLLRFAVNRGYISFPEWAMQTDNHGQPFTLPFRMRAHLPIDVIRRAREQGVSVSPQEIAAETGCHPSVAQWFLDNAK